MTIGSVLGEAEAALAGAGIDEARREARFLLADLLGVDASSLHLRRDERVSAELRRRYADWIERRATREPAQYIAGRVEFHGVELAVDARALIPRPETEGLVDVVLDERLPEGAVVLDAGTGSGCIAIALALARADLLVRAIDRSEQAVALARENVRRHGLEPRVEVTCADFGEVPASWTDAFDLVVSNPPYVPEEDWRGLQVEVRDHEPYVALVPGPTGLEACTALAGTSARVLRRGGSIVLEVGFRQAESVAGLLATHGFTRVDRRPDLAGIPRYVVARREAGA
jgi:release factor glutamine methyltransferase